MEISVRTAVFLVSDLLLSELQKGAEIVDVNIGDKVLIRQSGDAVSLYVGGKIVTTGGEIKNHFRFHHEARRKLTPIAKEVFEKIVTYPTSKGRGLVPADTLLSGARFKRRTRTSVSLRRQNIKGV